MNIYRVVLSIIDLDEIGAEAIKDEIENGRYGNDCISPTVEEIESRDIGEWSDDHPLNQTATSKRAFKELFS